jgi:hypothetical protein
MHVIDSEQKEWESRAQARWPGVPATHGWLSLDARGRWCLQGAAATHEGLKRFLSQHYRCDAEGAWFVQNGPQQVFVDLATAPFVAARDGDGRWVTHTSVPLARIEALIVDDAARLYFMCELGLVGLDDRDWPALLHELSTAQASAEVGDLLMEVAEHPGRESSLHWRDRQIALRGLRAADMERCFSFQRHPRG